MAAPVSASPLVTSPLHLAAPSLVGPPNRHTPTGGGSLSPQHYQSLGTLVGHATVATGCEPDAHRTPRRAERGRGEVEECNEGRGGAVL